MECGGPAAEVEIDPVITHFSGQLLNDLREHKAKERGVRTPLSKTT